MQAAKEPGVWWVQQPGRLIGCVSSTSDPDFTSRHPKSRGLLNISGLREPLSSLIPELPNTVPTSQFPLSRFRRERAPRLRSASRRCSASWSNATATSQAVPQALTAALKETTLGRKVLAETLPKGSIQGRGVDQVPQCQLSPLLFWGRFGSPKIDYRKKGTNLF